MNPHGSKTPNRRSNHLHSPALCPGALQPQPAMFTRQLSDGGEEQRTERSMWGSAAPFNHNSKTYKTGKVLSETCLRVFRWLGGAGSKRLSQPQLTSDWLPAAAYLTNRQAAFRDNYRSWPRAGPPVRSCSYRCKTVTAESRLVLLSAHLS